MSLLYLRRTPAVALKHLAVELGDLQLEERFGPVEGLGDARRLLELDPADFLDECNDLLRQFLLYSWNLEPDDLQLLLEIGVVQIQVNASSLERIAELPEIVAGEDHDRDSAWPRWSSARGY